MHKRFLGDLNLHCRWDLPIFPGLAVGRLGPRMFRIDNDDPRGWLPSILAVSSHSWSAADVIPDYRGRWVGKIFCRDLFHRLQNLATFHARRPSQGASKSYKMLTVGKYFLSVIGVISRFFWTRLSLYFPQLQKITAHAHCRIFSSGTSVRSKQYSASVNLRDNYR